MATKGITITSIVTTEVGDLTNLFVDIRGVEGLGKDGNGDQLMELLLDVYKDEVAFDAGSSPLVTPTISRRVTVTIPAINTNPSRDDLFAALDAELQAQGHTTTVSTIV